MANSVRRWLAGGEGKVLTAVVGGILLILIALGLASALIAFPLRVPYVCRGESPRPCTCYRRGEEPGSFVWNRSSMGPAEGVKWAALVVFGAGLICIVAWLTYRRSRSVDGTQVASEGLFKLLPGVGLALWLVALVIFAFSSSPGPCEDQGALGLLAGAWSGACDP